MWRGTWDKIHNNNRLDSATEALIKAVLATEEYQVYAAELNKVKEFPELKVQLDDFRRRNFELQSSADNDFNKLEQFEKEYAAFRENILVQDFLAAELDLCRLIQDLNMRITAALQFE